MCKRTDQELIAITTNRKTWKFTGYTLRKNGKPWDISQLAENQQTHLRGVRFVLLDEKMNFVHFMRNMKLT